MRVEGPSQARLEPKKNPDGSLDVAYFPTEPGEYAVHVLCTQDDIPKSPYMADIKPAAPGFDPSKVLDLTFILRCMELWVGVCVAHSPIPGMALQGQ